MSELLPEQTADETGPGWGDEERDHGGAGLRDEEDGETGRTRDAAWYDEQRPPHHDRD
ncbi:hypothetical protein BH24ACT13_BH24ACT13_15710 [soil metagenome]|jgi:hypothetical protein